MEPGPATLTALPSPPMPSWYLWVWQAGLWGHLRPHGGKLAHCAASLRRHERKTVHRTWTVTVNTSFTQRQRKTLTEIQSVSPRGCRALEFACLPFTLASKQRPLPTHNQEETDGVFDVAGPLPVTRDPSIRFGTQDPREDLRKRDCYVLTEAARHQPMTNPSEHLS